MFQSFDVGDSNRWVGAFADKQLEDSTRVFDVHSVELVSAEDPLKGRSCTFQQPHKKRCLF